MAKIELYQSTIEDFFAGLDGVAGPKVLWEASVGVGFSSITVADGKAYTMCNSGQKSGAKEARSGLSCRCGKEVIRLRKV